MIHMRPKEHDSGAHMRVLCQPVHGHGGGAAELGIYLALDGVDGMALLSQVVHPCSQPPDAELTLGLHLRDLAFVAQPPQQPLALAHVFQRLR